MESHYLLAFSLFFLITSSQAKEFLVGGAAGSWKIPSSTSESLNKWAEANRFQAGDSLVFKFADKKDSVLKVSREDYLACRTSAPLEEHKDENALVKLDRSGANYFISGNQKACEQGEKLIVVVMSMRHRLAPAPSPVEFDGPAVAPTSSGHKVGMIGGGLVSCLVVLFGLML
ncbi:putative Phytocyanin domain, cupredoxin [Dioscorea sansibarensis]